MFFLDGQVKTIENKMASVGSVCSWENCEKVAYEHLNRLGVLTPLLLMTRFGNCLFVRVGKSQMKTSRQCKVNLE